MSDVAVVGPTVGFLAGLATGGRALKLGVGRMLATDGRRGVG